MEDSDDLDQKIFLAIVLHESRRYRLYSLYFVNNTSDTIDAMIAVAPGKAEAMLEGAAMDAIGRDLVDNVGVRTYGSIPPRSYVELSTYFDWDFDWSSSRYIMLKTLEREEHLRFDIESCVMVGRELPFVPVLGKRGYACLGKRMRLIVDGLPVTPP